MNLGDIITRVRSSVGDQGTLQITDSDIARWVNDACREIAIDNELLQAKATSDTVVGQSAYDLPSGILKLHSVRYEGDPLKVYTLAEHTERTLLNESSSGTPTICYIWANQIELVPAPSSVGSLEIFYIKEPTAISETEPVQTAAEPDVPSPYHHRIVAYCVAQVAEQDEDADKYNLKMSEFKTGVEQLRDRPQWEADFYPTVSVSSRDMGYEDDWTDW